MTVKTSNYLKTKFQNGAKPTGDDFNDFIDSIRNKSDQISGRDVEGWVELCAASTTGIRKAISLRDNTPTDTGIYFPTEVGDYDNAGRVVVSSDDLGNVAILFDGNLFTKIPIVTNWPYAPDFFAALPVSDGKDINAGYAYIDKNSSHITVKR